MGDSLLAGDLANRKHVSGTGDTFGISCCCKYASFHSFAGSIFLEEHRFFGMQNFRWFWIGGSAGNIGGSWSGKIHQISGADGTAGIGDKNNTCGIFCDIGTVLVFLPKSVGFHFIPDGVSHCVYQYFARYITNRYAVIGNGTGFWPVCEKEDKVYLFPPGISLPSFCFCRRAGALLEGRDSGGSHRHSGPVSYTHLTLPTNSRV